MAQDNLLGITQGLFGVAPSGFSQEFATALPALAGRSATDIGTAAAYAGGKQLGRGLMGATGIEDPEMASANRAKQIAAQLQQQGISMQSSQGMKMLAQKLSESGDFKAAQAASALASNFEEKEASVGLKQAQTIKALREPRDTMIQQLMTSGKYTPASIAVFKESQNPADLVVAEGKPEMLDTASKKEIGKAESLNTILSKSNQDLDKYITDIENGAIQVGLGASAKKAAQGLTGTQSANTLKLESLQKFIERERNNILMAAKGTQTEGDAQRALSQILGPTNWTSSQSMVNALKDLRQYKQDQIDANNTLITSLSGSRKIGATPTTPSAPNKSIYNAVRRQKGWEDATDAEIDSAIKSGKIKTGKL